MHRLSACANDEIVEASAFGKIIDSKGNQHDLWFVVIPQQKRGGDNLQNVLEL